MYKCEILADSLSPQGNRLTTMKITFPRMVLAEFNTHRMFSRNSASSRAIPFKKMAQMVYDTPFIPIAWQKTHSGMQGNDYFTDPEYIKILTDNWLSARDSQLEEAELLDKSGVTKQLSNRLLEAFMWHTVIVTATEWENFFKLRCPQYYYEPESKYFRSKKDFSNYWFENFGSGIEEAIEGDSTIWWLEINKSQAEIHIQAIAELMWDAMNESTPKQLKAGEWHIPFGDNLQWDVNKSDFQKFYYSQEVEKDEQLLKVKIATARCARISYETLGDNPKIDYEADIKLHDILLKNGHASPLEHCAKAMSHEEYATYCNGRLQDFSSTNEGYYPEIMDLGWCRNFRGFIQYRAIAGV